MGKPFVKPIETTYKGFRFRSRLEARWAVFFDTVGIDWDYEVEGFQGEGIPGGRYLPDFKLFPSQGEMYVEIKGYRPLPEELIKMLALVEGTRAEGLLISGSPGHEMEVWTIKNVVGRHDETSADLVETTVASALGLSAATYRKGMLAARSARFEFGETPA